MSDGLVTHLGADTSITPAHHEEVRHSLSSRVRSLVSSAVTTVGYVLPEAIIDYHSKRFYDNARKALKNTGKLVTDDSHQVSEYRNWGYYKAMSLLDWLAPAAELTYGQLLANLDEYLKDKHPKESYVVTSKAVFSGNVVIELNPGNRSAEIISGKHAHLADTVKKVGFRIVKLRE